MNRKKYDPVTKAMEVERIVCRGDERKYYRFRSARFYGGIATADCVGCCLRCRFCWSFREVCAPGQTGQYYSPGQVADKLTGIALKKGYRRVRISGNEPTIGSDHLIKVIGGIPQNMLFILETNGILIGHDPTLANELGRFENLHVRVGLKGCDGDEFSRLTGALPRGFDLQIQGLENLLSAGVSFHPAVMLSFSTLEAFRGLQKKLTAISRQFKEIEPEEVALYRDVEKRIKNLPISSWEWVNGEF